MKKRNNYRLFVSIFFISILFSSFKNENIENSNIEVEYSEGIMQLYYYDEFNLNHIFCNIILDKQLVESIRMDRCYTKGNNWWICSIDKPPNKNYELQFSEYPYTNIFNKDNFDSIIANVENELISKNYKDAILILKHYINDSQNLNNSAYAEYLIAEIYLNDFKNYEYSASILIDIMNNYKESDIFKKALFTLSYVYANHLDYYTDAIIYYEKFIKLFPDDELIPSVKYELNNLYKVKF